MNGKYITKLGFTNKSIGLALAAAQLREAAGLERSAILDELSKVKADPAGFQSGVYADLVRELLTQQAHTDLHAADALRSAALPYAQFGAALIDQGARDQMNVAMRLPITRAGALMPDAHVGYGLPIGGVLAAENAVIPYGVGVDIGCSMRLSVFAVPADTLKTAEALALLQKHTRFGAGVSFERRERIGHDVLDEAVWDDQPILRRLHDKAADQIGSSGSGNHFAEFGSFTLGQSELGLDAGTYLALLTHSGSRGFGAQVAGHFTKLAESLHPTLHPSAKKLAWLSLDSEEGQAYWQAMNLAGRYALANHEQIHARIAKALGQTPALSAHNSHNLAWKEQVGGSELIVHRKGATPAAAGQLGLIPGSMADPGYLVRGKGHAPSLASASHGAGRQLGRKAAQNTLSKSEVSAYLKDKGVTLLGGGIDEAPQAYKRIQDVIAAQSELVDVLGEFRPKVVRMDSGSEDI
ncbi:RtcB family protein [Deinococcus psychrotolerans]|uniref:3'-phosphate/5'-hydroxy nucleic acid ligase n=1 Tax=Deinococcus psychrotolerans TaxID=2489213 RepID=A0A3G8YFH7_9DEIO|nr:RtcB family protein [Deinococcus psychrotolerans]AZI42937.1 RtcB family protein [Deinococcus psychrotolerans]